MKPAGMKPFNNDRVSKPMWICPCSPNNEYRSIDGVCQSCEEVGIPVAEYKAQNDTQYSAKVKPSTKQYDDLGRLISDSKGKPKRKPVKIECDMK